MKLNNKLFIVIGYIKYNIAIKTYDICKSIYLYPEETLFYWYSHNDLFRLYGYTLESDFYYNINIMNKKNDPKFLSLPNRVSNYIKLINYNY